MHSRLNASIFVSSSDIYAGEFENIIIGITACYKLMIRDSVIVPNDENKIRDILYNGYLNDNKVRNQIGLYFNIVCEPAEYINDECSGFVDLRIFSKNSLTDTSAYYIIECKRLNNQNVRGTTGLNAEYIKNGIMRFVSGQYSTNKYLNGMIGFVVEQMDIDNNIKNINGLLTNNFKTANTQKKLTPVSFIKKFKYSYYSIHNDIKYKNIKLYHLMFDFSRNMDSIP